MRITRTGRLGVALAAAVALLAALASPAGAVTPTPAFGGELSTVPFNVMGTYTPVPLVCTGEESTRLSIFWYAPGTADDPLWQDIDLSGPSLTYTPDSERVNGTYEPLVGDFDGDGCDDVFLYAAGPAPDFVMYWSGSKFLSIPVSVGGTYDPVVNDFDEDGIDDIYWYAPGAARDSMWIAVGDRSFTPVAAPQVSGTYQPVRFGPGGILWYAPGVAADYVTAGVAARTSPLLSISTTVNGTYQPVPMFVTPLLYAPGATTDQLVTGISDSPSQPVPLTTVAGQINGSYRVGATPSAPVVVLHAPGPATDQLLMANFAVG